MDDTRRHLAALDGTYRRMDSGQLTGRNSDATSLNLDRHWTQLQDALDAGGYEMLDANPRLAAKYARVERRHLLGREEVSR